MGACSISVREIFRIHKHLWICKKNVSEFVNISNIINFIIYEFVNYKFYLIIGISKTTLGVLFQLHHKF